MAPPTFRVGVGRLADAVAAAKVDRAQPQLAGAAGGRVGVPLRAKTRLAEGERGTGGERVPTGRRSRHAVRGEVPVFTGAAVLMGRRLPLRTACLERRLAREPSRYESCSLAAIRVSAHSGTWNGAHRCMS